MWRKTIALLPLFLLAFSPVFSAENSPENAPPEHVKVYIEGKECELSPPAVIRDGRTMVSLRSLSEALGAEIEWCEVGRVARAYLEDGAALNGDEGFASASYAENSAAPDGEGDFEPQDASGENATCDSARIIDGRIYVSLRSAAESFGYDVSWDSTNHAALLRENREKEHVAGFLSVDADLAEVETEKEEEEKASPVTGGYIWPVDGGQVTSPYGWRNGRFHAGTDIGASTGTSIFASDGGVVNYVGWESGYGNSIVIDHGYYFTRYAHNSANLVSTGETVQQGQVIARVGATGRATGPHLHFEIRIGGRYGSTKNPMNFISR